MPKSNYGLTNDGENEEITDKNTNVWKPLLRQIFVCSGVIAINITNGMSCGIPNVMIAQIRREGNSTEAFSEEMASWSTSIHGYAAVPWIILLPLLTEKLGRKIPIIFVGITSLIAYIMLYISTNNTLILISQVIQGILIGSNLTILVVIVAEYTSPRYRGVMMALKTSSFHWGVWIASAVGTFTHWKCINYITFASSLYSFTALFWPESPSWLATKGRYEDCAKAHYFLKGNDDMSEKDLIGLIHSHKERITLNLQKKPKYRRDIKNTVETFKSGEFYKPLLICGTILCFWDLSGKFTCAMYSLTLIEKITNSESTAYIGMLIVEAITLCAMQIGCILLKYLNRRTLLFTSSTIGIIFHFIISLYLYLIKLSIITEKHIVTLTLLTLFSMAIGGGPMILAYCLCGELTPSRFRSISLPILAIFTETLLATLLKIFPFMSKLLGLHGVFLFYGLSTSFFGVILFKHLPETKDKTLQEIENLFKEKRIDISPSSTYTSPLLDRGFSHKSPLFSVFSTSPTVPYPNLEDSLQKK